MKIERWPFVPSPFCRVQARAASRQQSGSWEEDSLFAPHASRRVARARKTQQTVRPVLKPSQTTRRSASRADAATRRAHVEHDGPPPGPRHAEPRPERAAEHCGAHSLCESNLKYFMQFVFYCMECRCMRSKLTLTTLHVGC